MLGAGLGARDAEWKRRTLGDAEPCMMIGFPKVALGWTGSVAPGTCVVSWVSA